MQKYIPLCANLQSEMLLIVEGGGEVLLLLHGRVGHSDVEVHGSVHTLMHRFGMIHGTYIRWQLNNGCVRKEQFLEFDLLKALD